MKVNTLWPEARRSAASMSVSRTCGRARARNSRETRGSSALPASGRRAAIAASEAAAIAATVQKVERQPNAWPSAVPAGTPSMFDAAKPDHTSDTAAVLRRNPDGDHRGGDSDEGPVAEGGRDTGGEQRPITRGHCASHVGGCKYGHKRQKRRLALHPESQQRDQGRPKRHAERIRRYEEPGRGDGDAEAACDFQ